jgi:chaperonin cofactor prefoldin
MACGSLFVEEEPKTETDNLKKELDDVKKEIEQLKSSMSKIGCNTEKVDDQAENLLLQKQIEDSEETIKDLSGQIEKQKNEITNLTNQLKDEVKNKKNGRWGWFFVALWIVSAFFVFLFWNWYKYENNRGDYLRDAKYDLQKKNDSLQKAYCELQNDFDSLISKYPIIVNKIEVAGANNKGSIGAFGGDIRYGYRDYIKPRISYEGYSDTEIVFKVLCYRSGDSYCSTSHTERHVIEKGSQVLELDLQKGFRNGKWPNGYYRLEIWCNNVMLSHKWFDFYY